jgi:hypothetical protein
MQPFQDVRMENRDVGKGCRRSMEETEEKKENALRFYLYDVR